MSPSLHLTLRAKLTAIVGIAALGLVLLTGASLLLAKRVEQRLTMIQQRYLPQMELEPQLLGLFERIQRGFQDAVGSRDAETLAAIRDLKRAFLAQVATSQNAIDPLEAAALRAALEDYFSAAEDVSRRLTADESGEAVVDAIASMQTKRARFAEVLKKATQFDRRELVGAFAAAKRAEAIANASQLWISLVCVVSVILLSTWIGRGVFQSVANLTAGVHRFGASDFGEPIRVVGSDEMGHVGEHAHQMAASLNLLARERRKAEEKFQALLEAAPDAMVIANEAGEIVLVNVQAERVFGYDRQELLGQPVEILMPERFRVRHADHRTRYLSDPKIRPMDRGLELYGRRKDGTEFPAEISLGPIDTEEGTIVSIATRDITSRKHIEESLILSNRELEAFSYSVAHDLRAPLRGIHGFSSALLEDCSDQLDDEGKDFLNRICAGAERMAKLIDALLALSRVSRAEIRHEAVNLSRIAETVVGQLRTSHPDRTVTCVIGPDVVVHGDALLLRTVLENLLGNAWKFTGACPMAHIAFGSMEKDGATVCYVRDNGAGFDMAYAEKLFAPFQRLHAAGEFGGTGIGLASVQRVVRRHGGRVWADAAVNQGATFFFTLAAQSAGGTFS